jgi:pimeloyl-ACP methyl ester carboxylesterase
METAISKDGTSIAFEKSGKGPALVLVDGAFCFRNNGPASRLVPLLAPTFTVFTYDRRGRGESGETLPYSIDREIEDLACIAAKTGEVPMILGFSSGAALVLHAIAAGLTAKKAALYEPPYVATSSNHSQPPKEAEGELSNLVNHGHRDRAVKYFMSRVMGIPAVFVFLFKLFGKKSWMKNESVAHTLAYDVALMGNFKVPTKITAAITVPILVLGGEKSPEKLRKAVEAVAMSIPKSQMRLLKGQSHNVSMNILAPVLTDFFNA